MESSSPTTEKRQIIDTAEKAKFAMNLMQDRFIAHFSGFKSIWAELKIIKERQGAVVFQVYSNGNFKTAFRVDLTTIISSYQQDIQNTKDMIAGIIINRVIGQSVCTW